MTDTYITRVPFPGFYHSTLSSALDSAEEREMEFMEEREGEYGERDTYVADPALRMKAEDLGDVLWRHMDYGKAHDLIARHFVEGLDAVLTEQFGFEVGMTFESMSSPREYNFTTDRVFAFLPVESAKRIYALAVADKERLAELIGDTFTSYDGFHSHYSNQLEDWLARPMEELDHNEWCLLIEAVVDARRGKRSTERLEDDVLEVLYYSDTFEEAFEAGMDWPAFEAAVAEIREGKLEALRELDPDYVPAYRCPETPDMFGRSL